jgi:hypothetical protein
MLRDADTTTISKSMAPRLKTKTQQLVGPRTDDMMEDLYGDEMVTMTMKTKLMKP